MKGKFGALSWRAGVHLLFWSGLAVIAAGSAAFGYCHSAYTRWVEVLRGSQRASISGGPLAEVTLYSLPLGILWGVLCFLVLGAVWRVLMEPLGDLMKLLSRKTEAALQKEAR